MSKVYKIYLSGEITLEKASAICEEIDKANSDDNYEAIQIVITSTGGKIYAAFAICDYIQLSTKPVDALAVGYCASAAVTVLQAARIRRATARTLFMIHQSHYELSRRSYDETMTDMKLFENVGKLHDAVVISRIGMSSDEFESACRPKTYLAAQEALSFGEYGLIDEIVAG